MITVGITRFVKTGGPLTKYIRLNSHGKVLSDGSPCLMSKGTAHRELIAGMGELAQLISNLKSNEAIATGTLRLDLPASVRITTKSQRDKMNGNAPPDLIARTADNIIFPDGHPALLLLDYDQKRMPDDVAARLAERGGFWLALTSIIPQLTNTAHLIRSSTSAGLYRKDTNETFVGSGGKHGYILILAGTDSDRFLKTLHQRCWLAGLGWLMIGAGGQFLERSIIDRAVGASERLIFEAPPILEPPLAQDAESRIPIVCEGDALDSMLVCPNLDAAETAKYRDLVRAEERRLTPERDKVRAAFISGQVKRLIERTGLDEIAARKVIERQCEGVLLPEIELPFDDPILAGTTVAQVLDRPESFVGETLADPIEGPAYGIGKAKILLRRDGTPWIHSFAHGRTDYELRREAPRQVVQVSGGKLPFVIDAAETLLIERDTELFERNGFPVYLGCEKPPLHHLAPYGRRVSFPYELDHLIDHWTRHVDFQTFNERKKDWVSINCPKQVAASYLQRRGRRRLRPLRAVISAPTLRPDGSILDKPGYDAETGLFYDPCGVEYPEMPSYPTKDDARAALDLLIKPISLFPFVPDNPEDLKDTNKSSSNRSVTLSAILTATIRASLPTAPLHTSTAPVAGSGKSMLDNCVSIIAMGRTCHPVAETTQTEEFEKRIASALIRGDQIIAFDNCTVPLGGGLLCQALTGDTVQIRNFGTLKDIIVENTSLILANGNNLILFGDVIRRALRAQLDPKCERPETRKFDFSPIEEVTKCRPHLVVAALTVLRAYHGASRPHQATIKPLGSFEDWSAWPRSALVWLGEPDPCLTMEAARDADPELKKLGVLLNAWHALFRSPRTIKRAIEEARTFSQDDDQLREQRAVLIDAMEAIAGVRNDINTRTLGNWISANAGKIVNGLRFEQSGERSGVARWTTVHHE